MTASQDLRAARARIERPEAWCKGDGPWPRTACCAVHAANAPAIRCGVSSYATAAAEKEGRRGLAARAYLDAAARDLFPTRYEDSRISALCEAAQVNDHEDTTYVDVLALYDLAIEMAEAEEAARG